jgi:hypothetical protein
MTEKSGFEKRIDEIAEVIQLAIPPSSSDHASFLGAHAWACNVEGEKYH